MRKPSYALATSSLMLLIPAWAAWKSGDTVRVWYHSGVAVISVTYHLTKHPVVFWIDFAVANSLVPSALPLVTQRDYMIFSYLACLGYCFGMFYYGYVKKDLMWHPDPVVATRYHISVHWAASFGLAFAILLTTSSLALERSRTPMSRLEVADAP
jgi:hypothetical protein